jgi:hypothetical protein
MTRIFHKKKKKSVSISINWCRCEVSSKPYLFSVSFWKCKALFVDICIFAMHGWNKAGDTLSSRHVSSCDVNACSWDVRGELTLNSMAQIHTAATLLTLRDLAWSSGWPTCQHASQISAAAHISWDMTYVHISWDVTYVSSALQTLSVVSRNGRNAYWKSLPADLFMWHQVTRL